MKRGGGEMGDGGGQFVVSRDQNDPDGSLVRTRVSRTYQRTAYALQILTVRDQDGNEQTLKVTDEHPFYIEHVGWTAAKSLEAGDAILGADSNLTVVENECVAHPEGVTVYNLEVEQAHTYFVQAESNRDTTAIWVHNTCISINGPAGRVREARTVSKLESRFGAGNVQREMYLRNAEGKIVRHNGVGRRIDAAVIRNGVADFLVEVTSKTADKGPQLIRELAIRANGGTYIRDRITGQLVDVSGIATRIVRSR